MAKRKTNNEFIKELQIKNPSIEILEKYINARTKIKCKCKYGHIWSTTPVHLLDGSNCPTCNGNKKKTHEEFVKELETNNSNIEVIGVYSNNKDKIKFKCKICSHEWKTEPTVLLKGSGCPKCNFDRQSLSNETFLDRINIILPNVEIIDKYTATKIKVKCKCKIDGYEWKARAGDLLSGSGCPQCAVNKRTEMQRKSHEDFIKELNIKNPDIEAIGTYKDSETKIEVKCLICGNIRKSRPANLLRGSGCPKCIASNGERIIEKYCKKNKIQYISQYRIKECKYKKTLPFDFALFEQNEIFALVEYQGKQHYESVKYYGGEKDFALRKKRDQIKRDYCKSNNIKLIEIPYWEDDIESYLENNLREIDGNENIVSIKCV